MIRDITVFVIAGAVGLFLMALAPDLLPEGWAWAAQAVGALVTISCVGVLIETLRHRAVLNAMARRFPGYSGERVPVCAFLAYSGPQGKVEGNANYDYALGISPSHLFLIHVSDYSGPNAGGRLLTATGAPLHMRRDEIVDVSVELLSDERITENARDKRDSTERIAETLALAVIGGSLGKTVPFAAGVVVRTSGKDGDGLFLFGIPTEIDHRVLALLDQTTDSEIAAGAPAGEAIKTAAAAGAEEAADAVLGEGMGELGGSMLGLLSPGRPAGSTKGATARRAAQRMAERIRRLAGHPPPLGSRGAGKVDPAV